MATPKSLLSSAALLMYVAILNFERAGARVSCVLYCPASIDRSSKVKCSRVKFSCQWECHLSLPQIKFWHSVCENNLHETLFRVEFIWRGSGQSKSLLSVLTVLVRQCGGFYLSCINFKVSQDGIAAADCINSGGNYSHSTINLDSYIANYHGVLGEGQGFSETCQDISWDGYGDPTDQIFLLANCWDSIQGTRDSTRFDLTYRLANTDGRSSGLDTVPLMYVRSSRLCPSTRTLPSSAASAAL